MLIIFLLLLLLELDELPFSEKNINIVIKLFLDLTSI